MNSCVSHDEFISVNNVLRKYNEIKKKNQKSTKYCGVYYIITMEMYYVKCQKN